MFEKILKNTENKTMENYWKIKKKKKKKKCFRKSFFQTIFLFSITSVSGSVLLLMLKNQEYFCMKFLPSIVFIQMSEEDAKIP